MTSATRLAPPRRGGSAASPPLRGGAKLAVLLALWASPALAQPKAGLPDGPVARVGVHRLRVNAAINDAAFTPDGKAFLAAPRENDTRVRVFDAATGRERRRLELAEVSRMSMARTKPLLAAVTKGSIEIWDLAAETRVQRWELAKNTSVYALALAPDGNRVVASAYSGDKSVLFCFDVATGTPLPTIDVKLHVTAVSFSPDGDRFVTTAPQSFSPYVAGAVITYDARTGMKLAERENRSNFSVVSPDGAKLARTVDEKRVEIIELATGKGIAELSLPHSLFSFSPDSKQLAIVAGERIQLWNFTDKQGPREIEGTVWSRNISPRFSPDGKLLAVVQYEAANINFVQFWDAPTGKAIQFPGGHSGTVNGILFSPDGKDLATISKGTIVISDPKTGEPRRSWVAHAASVEQIAYSPDSKLLASGCVDGWIILWDPATGKEKMHFDSKEHVRSLAFSRDGAMLVAAGKNRIVQCWDIASGKRVRAFGVAEPSPESIQIAPTGDQVAGFGSGLGRRIEGGGARLLRFHVPSARSLEPIDLRRADEMVQGIEGTLTWTYAFSPDSKLIATSDSLQTFDLRATIANHTVRVWETATRRPIATFSNNPVATKLLAISPDGRVLAHGVGNRGAWGRGADQTVILRDISAAQSFTIDGAGGKLGAPDPAVLLKVHRPLGGHQGSITCLAFSPDGTLLATGGSDQVAYVWRVADFCTPPELPEVKDVAELWPTLADVDPVKAYPALTRLERKPAETVALLRKHLQPVPSADPKTIAKHLRDLSSNNFAIRQQADQALEKAGAQAVHLLQKALKEPHSLEVRRRIETLIDKQERPLTDANNLRIYRALTLLERIATPDARKLLEELAAGAPAAWLTLEARAALDAVRRR